MDASIRAWVEDSPYGAALGVRLDAADERRVRLVLPFREGNANPGGALHGGCAASLAAIGAGALARIAQGAEAAPWHTAALQVDYLSAAISEAVSAEAVLLRQGKELCFAEVSVATAAGKPVAHATAAVRARHGLAPISTPAAAGDAGEAEPGPMGPAIEKLGFIAGRGIRIEHMAGGRSRLRMPWRRENAADDAGVHEGAVLALLDTTGAMASWAETGAGRYKASTPAIQAQLLRPAGECELVAWGRVAQRDHEVFWSDVEVAEAPSGRLVARGTVLYRIVT